MLTAIRKGAGFAVPFVWVGASGSNVKMDFSHDWAKNAIGCQRKDAHNCKRATTEKCEGGGFYHPARLGWQLPGQPQEKRENGLSMCLWEQVSGLVRGGVEGFSEQSL